MKKLLIATTNPGKYTEYVHVLNTLPLELISLRDIPDIQPVNETGATFLENAELKVRGYYAATGLPVIADDSGFEIDALDGGPGVKSRRWIHGDRDSTDDELIAYTMEHMRGVPAHKRTARLKVVFAFFDGKNTYTSTGAIEGVVADTADAEVIAGYPYRSLLFLPQFGKLYKDLTHAEHERINHRFAGLRQLIPIIQQRLA